MDYPASDVPAANGNWFVVDPNSEAVHYNNQQVHSHGSMPMPNSSGCASCGQGNANVAANPPMYVATPNQMQGLTSGACYSCIRGVDCANAGGMEQGWENAAQLDFEPLHHGEYIGPVRIPSMLQYRIRVGDDLQFIYVLTREKQLDEYKLMVGDELLVESITDTDLKRGDFIKGLTIQADGTIVLRLIGRVPAAGKTIAQLRMDVEQAYTTYQKNPAIDITPIKTNTRLDDLRAAVSNFAGVNGGQNVTAKVNPDGRIQLPLIGSIYLVGMTIEEAKREINLTYRQRLVGIEVEPRLVQQAPHFVYVFGEVTTPGRFEISQPTTVTQALAMAQGLKLGANNRTVVVFRRGADWRLVSTVLDIRGAHLGKKPTPADEIWLRDNDLIIVPPRPIRLFNNFVRQVFTEGAYGVIPPGLSLQLGNNNN